eukprot:1968237-Amphidinium_carterae.1
MYRPYLLSLAFFAEPLQRLAPFGAFLPRLAPKNTRYRRTKCPTVDSRAAQLFAQHKADTSSALRGRSFYEHLAGEGESSPLLAQSLTPGGGAAGPALLSTLPSQEVEVESGVEDAGSDLDVRVDGSMEGRVPVVAEGPEVFGPRVVAAAEGPEVIGTVYRVGPHTCHLTDGDARMTCRKCGRYVTSYKGTWRNLGTIAKQPCKPKVRRQKGREGKAPSKQSG